MNDNLSREERLREIRHTLLHEDEYFYYRYEEDVAFLLQCVAELERENERLRAFMGRTNLDYASLGRRNLLREYDRLKKGGHLDMMGL